MIQDTPHDGFADVFVGMGGVFLKRTQRPPFEAINDLSGDVANLYRVARRHHQALIDTMEWLVASRDEFDRQLRTDPTMLTDIERAARFLFIQRLAFGGKVAGRTFGVSRSGPSGLRLASMRANLRRIKDRLASVVIERLPWDAFVTRYDRPGMLFYLDPPYYGSEGDYGRELFDRGQFEAMAEALSRLSGGFILSLNDHPDVRRIFSRFAMVEVATTYTLAGGAKAGRFGELIIRGGANATS